MTRSRALLVCSFLGSAIVNFFAWAALLAQFPLLRVPAERPRAMLVDSTSLVQVARPRRRAPSPPLQTTSLAPPQPAALSLPAGWVRQDFGNKAATDTALWLDWTKQTADFVPRVFLWQMQAAPQYMRRPSLDDAVRDVLATLRAQHARVYASKPQRLCGGERPGWFFSYAKAAGDPPLRFDETLFMSNGTIYRATYMRPADQPEDPKTRAALNTLCS